MSKQLTFIELARLANEFSLLEDDRGIVELAWATWHELIRRRLHQTEKLLVIRDLPKAEPIVMDDVDFPVNFVVAGENGSDLEAFFETAGYRSCRSIDSKDPVARSVYLTLSQAYIFILDRQRSYSHTLITTTHMADMLVKVGCHLSARVARELGLLVTSKMSFDPTGDFLVGIGDTVERPVIPYVAQAFIDLRLDPDGSWASQGAAS